jgi:hypothetical protein
MHQCALWPSMVLSSSHQRLHARCHVPRFSHAAPKGQLNACKVSREKKCGKKTFMLRLRIMFVVVLVVVDDWDVDCCWCGLILVRAYGSWRTGVSFMLPCVWGQEWYQHIGGLGSGSEKKPKRWYSDNSLWIINNCKTLHEQVCFTYTLRTCESPCFYSHRAWLFK